MLESSRHTSYSACGIPYWIAGDVGDPQRLLARSAGQHRQMGVDLRMGVTATRLDLSRRLVHYRDECAVTYTEPFDELVLATGAPAVTSYRVSSSAIGRICARATTGNDSRSQIRAGRVNY